MSVAASGLDSPDGLAVHPETGELYVSEEGAGRVSVIRAGTAVPVLGPRIRVSGEIPDWAVTEQRSMAKLRDPVLASPEGLAFGPSGELYVVEDRPHGRVLVFPQLAAGADRVANLVPVPDLGEGYAWEGIAVGRDGGLFLAGAAHEGGAGWGSSCVLNRDATQAWWVVDSGALASFSAVALAEDESIMIAGDEAVGALTWWDLRRRRELQTLSQNLRGIEGVAVLPDGSLAVALEGSPDDGGGRLIRLDPTDGSRSVIADGLGTLESVVCDRRSGRIYVAEDSSGRVLCFAPTQPFGDASTLLRVTRRAGEARRGVSPQRAPDFLRDFMERVGVPLADGVPGMPPRKAAEFGGSLDSGEVPPLTLEELGKRVPLVAGRVRVEENPRDPDPITEINFISLFPNQIVETDRQPTPSLCLFSAKRRSGAVQRSRVVAGMQAHKVTPSGRLELLSANSILMLPLTTCTAFENDNGVAVTMTFLGLGRFEDTFLTINYGRRNEAYLTVAGEEVHVAPGSFTEAGSDGTDVVNFAMTGVRPRRVEDATWMRLLPLSRWSLFDPRGEVWVSRWALANMPELVERMRRFSRESIASLLAEPAPPDLVEAASLDSSGASPEGIKLESTSTTEPTGDRASRVPSDPPPPVANRAPASPHDEEQLLTNIILSRIVQAWNDGVVP